MRAVCDMRCFECPYPDCICNVPGAQELLESEDRDRKIAQERRGKRKKYNSEKALRYYYAHRDERIRYAKAYQEAHRDEQREKKREHYQRHKTQYAANQRARYEADPERFLQRRRELYHTDHPLWGREAILARRDERYERNVAMYGERQRVLYELRKWLGKTQAQMGAMVGVAGATWGNWEKGRYACDVDGILAVIRAKTGKEGL